MDTEWPPAPPEAYRLHDPEYEQSWYVTVFLYVWIVGVFVGVLAAVIAVHGPDTVVRLVREVLQLDAAHEWVAYIVWSIGTVVVLLVGHEALHALAGRWFGLETEFHLKYSFPLNITPSVVTYGEFQSRGESLTITLAPLLILTPVSIITLVAGQELWLVAAAAVIALGNAAGAVGDLASAWLLWSLPDGELVFHDNEGRRQYYTPASEYRSSAGR